MSVVGAWEEFIIESFIRYLTGTAAPGGYIAPLRIGPCKTISHATDLLAGEHNFNIDKNYLSMSNWDSVLTLAKIHFTSGQPFSLLSNDDKDTLRYASLIRNRVAHKSPKCITQFNATAKIHLGIASNGQLPQGTDPGRLLNTVATNVFNPITPAQTYYEKYSLWFRQKADQLVP